MFLCNIEIKMSHQRSNCLTCKDNCFYFLKMASFCGERHTVILDPFGLVWATGSNVVGQIGLGDTEDAIHTPTQINELHNIKAISCGKQHTVCCDDNGNVFSFGFNLQGQLGLGDKELRKVPSILPAFAHICFVSCGESYTMCIDLQDRCWGFGDNRMYQLGCQTESEYQDQPIPIGLEQISHIACGANFTLCIKKFSGTVLSFGHNSCGQLGLGDNVRRDNPTHIPNLYGVKFIACGVSHSLFLMQDGIVMACGGSICGETAGISSLYPMIIENLPKMKKISCGRFFSLGLDKEENLWVFGSNENGQLGEEIQLFSKITTPRKSTKFSNIVSISTGLGNHTFVNTLCDVWSFGNNDYGQLGNSSFFSKLERLPESIAFIWQYSRVRTKSARK